MAVSMVDYFPTETRHYSECKLSIRQNVASALFLSY